MRTIKLLVLLIVLLFLVGQQGATGDRTDPQNEATRVPGEKITATADATTHHQPNQHPPFFSKANLERIIMPAKIFLSRTKSYLLASQDFQLSLQASHNITSHSHRSLIPDPSHPSEIAHNAAQTRRNRLDDIAAIANLANVPVQEVPWLALWLEGWARKNADVDIYKDVLIPATKIGAHYLIRALLPDPIAQVLAIGEHIFIERGISSRHPKLRYLEARSEARSDITSWIPKEVVMVDRTSYDITIQECKTTTTHGVLLMSLCFFAENVTEAGWVQFRLTWSVMVIGTAYIYFRNWGRRDCFKALPFFVVVYIIPGNMLDLSFKLAQFRIERRRG